jgi:hypothetical protein
MSAADVNSINPGWLPCPTRSLSSAGSLARCCVLNRRQSLRFPAQPPCLRPPAVAAFRTAASLRSSFMTAARACNAFSLLIFRVCALQRHSSHTGFMYSNGSLHTVLHTHIMFLTHMLHGLCGGRNLTCHRLSDPSPAKPRSPLETLAVSLSIVHVDHVILP